MLHWIIDGILAVILLIFVIVGAKRGMILTLCSLLAVIVALVGAAWLSNTYAPKLADVLEPKITRSVEKKIDAVIEREFSGEADPEDGSGEETTVRENGIHLPGAGELSVGDLFDKLDLSNIKIPGLNGLGELIAKLKDRIKNGTLDATANAVETVAGTLALSIARVILFVAGFVVVLLLWHLLARLLDLVAKLPVLEQANTLGGALLGLLKGSIFFFLGGWVLRSIGQPIPEELVQETYLLRFFLRVNPIALILGVFSKK